MGPPPRPDGVARSHGRRAQRAPSCARPSTTSPPRRSRPTLPWINVAPLRMDQQLGRPVLIEFWDFCRANSIRTLPYVKAWHERYSGRAARDRRPRRRVRAVEGPGRGRGGGRAPGDSLPGRGRRRARDLAAVRQPRLAGALPVQPGGHARRLPLRRGRVRGDRASDPGAARDPSRRRSSRSAPRTRPTRGSRPRATTSTGRTAVPTRPAACGRCSTATAP